MHCAHQIVRGVDGLGAVANEQRLRGQLGPGDLQSNRVGMVLAGYAGFLLEFTCTALAWGASGCWALPLPHDHQLAGFASCPAVGLQSTCAHVQAHALHQRRFGLGGPRSKLDGNGGAGLEVRGIKLLHRVPAHLPAMHHVGAAAGAAVAHGASAVVVPAFRRGSGGSCGLAVWDGCC